MIDGCEKKQLCCVVEFMGGGFLDCGVCELDWVSATYKKIKKKCFTCMQNGCEKFG